MPPGRDFPNRCAEFTQRYLHDVAPAIEGGLHQQCLTEVALSHARDQRVGVVPACCLVDLRPALHTVIDQIKRLHYNMEGGAPAVALSDLEKSVDAKVLTQYLTASKALPNILKFTHTNHRFLLHFATQKDADAFLWERAFRDQIIARKLNLYPASFDE